jgi:D-alanine-D-alanine ligase
MANTKPKIALLLGGSSSERAVSKSSGLSIYSALINLGYETKLIDPAYGKNQPKETDAFFSEKDFSTVSTRNYLEAVSSSLFDDVDLAFLGLHGKWGEDGTIQSLLEVRGVKYSGSNVMSSAVAMDKAMSKIIFRHFNISTPKWFMVERKNIEPDKIKKKIDEMIGYPCIIKPNDEGSTVGLAVCNNPAEVESGLKLSFEYSDRTMIEEFIEGRELTVTVLDKEALPVLEIRPKHGLYDYECKYTKGMSEYYVPADIPDDLAKALQKESLEAFNALGCSVYCRLDYRLDKNNNFSCLEANTLPGMTSTSLVPKMAKAVGISFEELIDRIIKLSL